MTLMEVCTRGKWENLLEMNMKLFIFHLVSKTNQLNLKNSEALTKEEQTIKLMENPYDVICPVKILQFYKGRCHPNASRFFAKIVVGERNIAKLKKEFPKKTIWYHPAADGNTPCNIGHNQISKFMKILGVIIGVDNVDKFTNHGLCGYGITKMHQARVPLAQRMKFARHKCEQSQIPYARLTKDGFIEAQLALRGVNGTSDKIGAETNAKLKESNKRKIKMSKTCKLNEIPPKIVSTPPQIDDQSVLSDTTNSEKSC